MALIRTKDIRAMRPEDIMIKFKELSDELMHERGVAAMGGAPASPGRIRALRTNVARIHTIMREMELAEEKKAAESGPKKPKEKAGSEPKVKKDEKKPKKKEQKPAGRKEEEKK